MSTGFAIKPYEQTIKRRVQAMGPVPTRPLPVVKPDKVGDVHGPQRRVHDGYYDLGPMLSHNALWYLIAGARGIGKTFDWKRKAINRYLKRKEQFIYLRRFEEELKSVDQFFADIAHLYPEWDFRVVGRQFQIAPASTRDEKRRDWDIIGFAVALSTAQNKKGVSYHRVTWVGFDEFILEKSAQHYLPNEAEILLNFYNTVDRFQEKTILVCLANAVSIDNPYFTYLKILPDKEVIKDSKGFWIAHFPKSEAFKASIASTRFGQFIEGTAYYDYSVQNQFHDNHKHLVGLKNEKALHYFNLEIRTGAMAIWQDVVGGKWYATAKPVNGQLTLTLLPEKHTEETTLVFMNSPVIVNLMDAFQSHRLYFDTPATRNIFLDLFNGSRRVSAAR